MSVFGKRIFLEPKTEILYPDSHGYIGYSIYTWDIPNVWNKSGDAIGNFWEDLVLKTQWGGFCPSGYMVDSPKSFILEGRFFVFGALLCHAVVSLDISRKLVTEWKPVTHEILEKIDSVSKKGNGSVHIDDVIDQDIATKLKDKGLYFNRSEYFRSRGWQL